MRTFKLVGLVVVLLGVLTLAIQNTDTVTLHVLGWDLSMSVFVLVLIIFIVAFFTGAVATKLAFPRRRSGPEGEPERLRG